jgi:hypothetical protein
MMFNSHFESLIDFKIFVKKNNISFYDTTCSLSQLDEKINHMKISKF